MVVHISGGLGNAYQHLQMLSVLNSSMIQMHHTSADTTLMLGNDNHEIQALLDEFLAPYLHYTSTSSAATEVYHSQQPGKGQTVDNVVVCSSFNTSGRQDGRNREDFDQNNTWQDIPDHFCGHHSDVLFALQSVRHNTACDIVHSDRGMQPLGIGEGVRLASAHIVDDDACTNEAYCNKRKGAEDPPVKKRRRRPSSKRLPPHHALLRTVGRFVQKPPSNPA